MILGLLLTLCLASAANASGSAAGSVHQRQGAKLAPLPKARVVARSLTGAILMATTTDTRGRYFFAELPAGRVSLSAARGGYLTRWSGQVKDSKIVLDCSDKGACAEVNFELVRGAVVEGRVVDQYAEPLQRIAVTLLATNNDTNARSAHRSVTDDRGVFRIAGGAAGEYRLTAVEPAALHAPDISYQSADLSIEVGEGRRVSGLQLAMGPVRSYRVSGFVRHAEPSREATIEATPLPQDSVDSPMRLSKSVPVSSDGRFDFWGLPPGRYSFLLSGLKDSANGAKLGSVEVNRDLTALVLQPVRPSKITGVFKLDEGVAPGMFTLRLESKQSGEGWLVTARAPNYEFELSEVTPGEYVFGQLDAQKTRFYPRALRISGTEQDHLGIRVAAGETARVEVSLAADFGTVAGRLKEPRASGEQSVRAASHYRVALAGTLGMRSVQADQHGRFLFDHVVPGDYRICAWQDAVHEAVQSETLWRQAGPAVRTFPVEANSEVEIDLTAAP